MTREITTMAASSAHHFTWLLLLASIASLGIASSGIAAGAAEDPVPAAPPRNPHVFPGTATAADDWRCFENGEPRAGITGATLPEGYGYSEGLQDFVISDRLRMQTVTVARRHEGHPSQHIIARRSRDDGATWEAWFDVEPEGPPIASYGGFVRHPRTGRIYFLYNYSPPYNRTGKRMLLPDGKPFRGTVGAPHHIGKAVFRYVDAEGVFGAERHELAIPVTAIDRDNAFAGAYQMFLVPPRPHLVISDHGYSLFCKFGGPKVEVNQGEVFVARYENYLNDDRLEQLKLTLLPPGDHGIRAPDSLCATEAQTLFRENDHWSMIFRTTSGRMGFAQTSDLWQTVKADNLRYAPGGRPLKNPEGPMTVSRDGAGRTFIAFYNNQFTSPEKNWLSRGGRDLVFISHVRLADGEVHVSQPEVFCFHRDQSGREATSTSRLNCPGLRVIDGVLVGGSSDKTSIRRFPVPPAFIDALAGQHEARGMPGEGLLADLAQPGSAVDAPPLPDPSRNGGFSLTIAATVAARGADLDLIDGRAGSAGIRLATTADDAVVFTMHDGERTVSLASDPGSVIPGQRHVITITCDGHADLLSMVIDGRLQDGGETRERGTTWFDHAFAAPTGAMRWTMGSAPAASIDRLVVHGRFLLTSEAVGLHRQLTSPP